jgi:hypothetical protein
MDKYIKVYNDAISTDFCDKIVAKFEKNSSQIEIVDNEERPSFQQINLHQHDEWAKFRTSLSILFKKYLKQYKEDCGITEYHWPEQYGFEEYRMKRYLPNDKDQFKAHVDVQSYASARRFLVFFLYCSDNEAGQTMFNELGINIDCSKASLLMFPPLWPYLHSGAKAIIKPKYIIGSYLHYI